MQSRPNTDTMTTPRAILFDFDGTLADSFAEVLTIYNSIVPMYGLVQIPEEDKLMLRERDARQLLKDHSISWWKAPLLIVHVLRELKKTLQHSHVFLAYRRLYKR